MSDKKIPGLVYVIVGAAVVLMSVFIGVNSGLLEKFALFIFIGAIFIFVGFFKIIMKDKKSADLRAQHAHPHHAQHPAPQIPNTPHHHAAHAQHQQHHAQHSQVVRCSGCNVKLHPLFKYCPSCGQKLK
jgi:ABC-type nickel/cobalt efflux system permease component RcnA